MIPILDINGKVIGFGGRVMGDGKPKYINTSDTVVFDKSRNLFAMNIAGGADEKGLSAARATWMSYPCIRQDLIMR